MSCGIAGCQTASNRELKDLPHPLLGTSTDIERAARLNAADHLQDLWGGDLIDGPLSDAGENVPLHS